MVNTALYFISSLFIATKSDLSCLTSNGCGQFATCDYEFVANKVYGCGGSEWGNNGVSNGEYLCGDGYTICPTADRASALGLTSDLCLSTDIETDYYYASLAGADQSSTESSTCVDGGINNLFGCTNPATDFITTSSINCGPLGAMLTTQTSNNGEGWKEGWEPWADPWNQLDEVIATRHLKTQLCDPPESTNNCQRTDTVKGGVLCCLEETDAPTTTSTTSIGGTATTAGATTASPTDSTTTSTSTSTSGPDLSCSTSNGCGQFATCDYEFVENEVYGCGGSEWGNNGVSNGEYLCGDGFSICPSADRAAELGLTSDLCLSPSIQTDYYYVSLAGADGSSTESSTCVQGGENNLFGCTNPATDFVSTESINCGPFGAMLSTQTSNAGEGWKAGWEPWWGSNQQFDEVIATQHLKTQLCDPPESTNNCQRTDAVIGGVLCCRDRADATPVPTPQPTAPTTAVPTVSPTYFTEAQLERINEWKSRAVYQVITDRFARDDGKRKKKKKHDSNLNKRKKDRYDSDSASDSNEYDNDYNCTDLTGYCGGNFQGIISKLDYIQGLGYDAIWISPVVENTKDGYHGYWAKNLYEINPYYGTEDDLIELVDELHERDMYLMMDIVINHMGRRNTSAEQNYSYDYTGFTPFNSDEYYHDSCNLDVCDEFCSIRNFDFYNGIEEIEKCRLAGLPDLNQSNPDVLDLLCSWVGEYVEDKWMADALRLDTVPEVAIEYWEYFLSSECISNDTFNVGEYFWGDPALLGPYQPAMDSLFNYPMYYTLIDVFGQQQTMQKIQWRLDENKFHFMDYSGLGLFTDNHDNKRWLCTYDDITNYKNAQLFIHTFPGIAYGYYGTEQGFDGCDDPENREPLWESDYDTESELYLYIATVNEFRKKFEIYDGDYNTITSEDDLFAYTRGDSTLIVLTNTGESVNRTITVNTLKSGIYCNVFDIEFDCVELTSNELVINIDEGAGKFYIAMEDHVANDVDRIYVGIYAVFMTILMTFCNF